MKNLFFRFKITILIFIFFSCTSHKQEENCLTLKVQLEDRGVSFYDLFDKIELIPLELNENSYIKQIEHLQLINDTLYVFDREVKSLIMFDGVSGKHIHTIMKVGEGPEEYTHVYDVIIDSSNQEINFLSPFGFINTYDLSGHFIKRNDLPIPPNSYLYFSNYDDSTYVIWGNSLPESAIGNIVLLSKKTNQIINSFWKGQGLEDRFVVSPFWTYNDKTYFSTSITNNVYQVTLEGYDLAYKWDFGKYDIDKFREKEIVKPVELKNSSKRIREIIQQMITSDKLYRFNRRYENNQYYYAQIVFKNEKSLAPHIFYHKESRIGHYFLTTTEGLSFITYALTDDYILGELLTTHKNDLLASKLLNEEDQITLNRIKDDDNPVIVKIYFDKR